MADNELRRGIITLFHDHKATGHPGITKTLQLIAPYYWWPNMKTFVTEYIRGCASCQMSKINHNPVHSPLFPISPTENAHPFKTIALDFITKLPPSGGYDTILTITDTDCSKASIFLPCVKAPSCLKVRLARLVLRRVLIEQEVFERYQRLLEEMT